MQVQTGCIDLGFQAYATTFEQIEKLRELMLAFVKSERRDFQPNFDVTIVDFPDQEKMTLSADIRYKSNWQQGALKGRSTCSNASVMDSC